MVSLTCSDAQGLYMGVGLGLGGVIGGLVYDKFGAQHVFFCAAAVMAAGWIVVSMAQLLIRCRQCPSHAQTDGLHEPLLQEPA